MASEFPIALLGPNDLHSDKASVLTTSTWRLLAQGDSWFSIGQLPPWLTGNLLFSLRFPESSAAVSYASPGKTFAQMVDWHRETSFAAALAGGNLAYQWDAILLSAGGNDLFDAILLLPDEPDPDKASRRILLTPAERSAIGNVARYVRNSGWNNLIRLLVDCFAALISKRDSAGSRSRFVPIFVHTYDCPQPRWAPAGPGIGPWLARAFKEYQIPEDDWLPLTRHLIQQWAQFLGGVNATLMRDRAVSTPNVVPVNLIGTLSPAPAASTGESGDWRNEIHPSFHGYAKLAVAFEKQVHIVPTTVVAAA
ncbi:hypothetical protein WN982_40100 [Paraburkholderia sp. IMGN_8]|uniref:hypothetical protein n=1 Tax=Paraburkholderia sp. IMGN_8 TaxID=3136564 RepID=UPI003101494B